MGRSMIVAVAIAAIASGADAQPRFDVFGGGQFAYRPPEPTARDWLVTGGYRISERFDYMVEIAWHQRRDLQPMLSPDAHFGQSTAQRWFQVATGIRGRLMRERRLSPFYQGLVGLLSFSPARPEHRLLMLRPWSGPSRGPWGSLAPLLLQPGVGLDVTLHPGVKARFAADLMMVFFAGHRHDLPRASAGLAVQF